MAKGGKRAGAGRPQGARTLVRVTDYFTDKELKDFWDDLKKRARTDNKIALYFAEQLSGKAPQALDITSGGEQLKFVTMNYGENNSDPAQV